jgi:putative acetyltransferase
MIIRRYSPADRDAVLRIHTEAFRRPDDPDGVPPEVGLVIDLIEAGDVVPQLSLVAIRDGSPVGHVLGSRATVGAHSVVALGPVGVLPEHQRAGIGLAMMHAVLAAADAMGVALIALLGSTRYYSRFGFVSAAQLGIVAPDRAWGQHFQVRTLAAYDPQITGSFRYAPAFDSVS